MPAKEQEKSDVERRVVDRVWQLMRDEFMKTEEAREMCGVSDAQCLAECAEYARNGEAPFLKDKMKRVDLSDRVEVAVVDDEGLERSGTASVESWSDTMDASHPVKLPDVRPVLGPAVKRIKFGGAADVDEGEFVKTDPGFYKSYIRVPRVRAFLDVLQDACGTAMPKKAMEEVALVTYTTATVPAAFLNGPRRLRGMMAIGDAVLTFVLMSVQYSRGQNVASAQAARAEMLSNPMLSNAFVRVGWDVHISSQTGINMGTAKVGADCLEAIVGVVARWRSLDEVARLMRHFGLL